MTNKRTKYQVLTFEYPHEDSGEDGLNMFASQEFLPGIPLEENSGCFDSCNIVDLLIDQIPVDILGDMKEIKRHYDMLVISLSDLETGLNGDEHELFCKKWAQTLLFCKIGAPISDLSDEEFYNWYMEYFSENEREILGEEFIWANSLAVIKVTIAKRLNEIMDQMLKDYPSNLS